MKKPIICVPVLERTGEEIKNRMSELVAQGVHMIEWRADWFEDVQEEEQVRALLKELAPIVKDTSLLATFRSRNQGGYELDNEISYPALLKVMLGSEATDYIDLEFYEIPKPWDWIYLIQSHGKKVVASQHELRTVPDVEAMKGCFYAMKEAGADLLKLAVMPGNKKDVLHLMAAVLEFQEESPETPIIAMSMGQEGVITRFLGEWYGSEVTFATFGPASAPGQMSYGRTKEMVEKVHEIVGVE